MNVLFHTVSAIGVVAMVTDTSVIKSGNSRKAIVPAAIAFFLAVFFHGILDYMPHCYPVQSRWDVILGLCIMVAGTLMARRPYQLIVAAAFWGCILPDIIDLLPAILNKYLGWKIPVIPKLFPWHWKENSGSIYTGNCKTSLINHWSVLIFALSIVYARRRDLKMILK
ncbi:hypothetical protein U0035_18030 [Niabella yanshanensis]|uniref:Metal-dependent hydrolase n=1 Tax=Niabella yanshanensis TaxID=577386 RepID=A0ABZ0W4U6_9BACT|nr:hypothetical protein [Niabella yanshanensis]WQD37574.1 hypothetical protein U0035_18030 [Niabella yanshanensis]